MLPHPHTGGWASKKVANIPVVYLAVAGAFLLVLLAYHSHRAKKAAVSVANTTGAPPDTAASSTLGTDLGTPPAIVGTVSSDPNGQLAVTNTNINPAINTNDQWLHQAATYLITQGNNPGDVQLALQTYMNGQDLSYEQGKLRDAAVAQYGLPPASFDSGITAPKTVPTPLVTNPTEQAIEDAFKQYLGREPSRSDILFQENSGATIAQIRANIARSPEAVKHQGGPSNVNNDRRAAIESYYVTYLHRQPSASDILFYDNTPLSLPQIETAIANSPEARSIKA